MNELDTTNTQEDALEQIAQNAVERAAPAVLQIPQSKMGEIKRKEADRGRREALAELDRQAQLLGYSDHAGLLKAVQEDRAKKVADQAREAQEKAALASVKKSSSAEAAKIAALEAQARKAQDALALKMREEKQLQRQLAAAQLERQFVIEATRCGVAENALEYAVDNLRRHVSSLPADARSNFDAKEFFSKTLKAAQPFLYQPSVVPATTSPAPAAVDEIAQKSSVGTAPPSPPQVVDAMKMTREQFQAHLASRNLRIQSR